MSVSRGVWYTKSIMKNYLSTYNNSILFLRHACSNTTLHDRCWFSGLGTHFLPFRDGLDSVRLEEFKDTPAVVGLSDGTDWAGHLVLMVG